MKWKILRDLNSGRGTRLSPGKAVLANMIETNRWQRPICFSLGCHPPFLAGLDSYFQLYGLVNRLLPVKTTNSILQISPQKVEQILLNPQNVKDFADVQLHDMPRVSNILFNYYIALYRLAMHYKEQNQLAKVEKIADYMKTHFSEDIFPRGRGLMQKMGELAKNR